MDSNDRGILSPIGEYFKLKAINDVLHPIEGVFDKNIRDIATSIGTFLVREISGKLYRQISFTVGLRYADDWMEEALYGVLYKYNDVIKRASQLELTNKNGYSNGSMMYARLADGAHTMKYRKWTISIGIGTVSNQTNMGRRIQQTRTYVILVPSLDPEFVELFKNDLINQRDAILKLNSTGPLLNCYKDYHEADGDTYWIQLPPTPKRHLDTMFMPREQLQVLVSAINTFFADRDEYQRLGVPWNLKILLYGPGGSGKTSLAKVIASEWGRNLYEIDGGKNGKFVPNSLEVWENDAVQNPLFVVNDIDRYPQLVSEAKLDINKEKDSSEERQGQKQVFRRFLNALDGSSNGEGKIIIVTANDISQFSPILLREGRFDIKMKLGFVTEETFRKYVRTVFRKDAPDEFYLSSDDLTIAKFNRDTLILKMGYDEFMAKYTQSTPPVKKPPKEEPAETAQEDKPPKKKKKDPQ